MTNNQIVDQLLLAYPNASKQLLIEYVEYCKTSYQEGETHHILPRHDFKAFENGLIHSWNITTLPAFQHLLVHYKLAKAIDTIGSWQSVQAMLMGVDIRIDSTGNYELIELIKERTTSRLSVLLKSSGNPKSIEAMRTALDAKRATGWIPVITTPTNEYDWKQRGLSAVLGMNKSERRAYYYFLGKKGMSANDLDVNDPKVIEFVSGWLNARRSR